MIEKLAEQQVGHIVAEDYRAAQVFRAYGVDFCCGGKQSLENVCASKNIDLSRVLDELKNLKQAGGHADNYNEWELDFLTDYIVHNHHNFVRKNLPELNFYANKVAMVHGSHHPELHEILEDVKELSAELTEHMDKEEKELFPQIKELIRNSKKGLVRRAVVEALEEEHDKAGSIMARIEALSDGFTPPADACASYRVLFQSLEGFQKDLHKHVHLENNILFPKALDFESRLA